MYHLLHDSCFKSYTTHASSLSCINFPEERYIQFLFEYPSYTTHIGHSEKKIHFLKKNDLPRTSIEGKSRDPSTGLDRWPMPKRRWEFLKIVPLRVSLMCSPQKNKVFCLFFLHRKYKKNKGHRRAGCRRHTP